MMLNSIGNYKRLILALVCGSMSYSTFAKVYSWRDADGAMHYSQFPRQIVEKNAAQSRASRKPTDINDVVNDLSETKNSNLLDGLDDIVANASAEREVEKVLTRRDPQLVLIEQQLARQQAEQQALALAKQVAIEKESALMAANNAVEPNHKVVKQKRAANTFMAGIHKRAYGSVKNTHKPVQAIAAQETINPIQVASSPQTASVPKQLEKNKFLAEIQKKLKRNKSIEIAQSVQVKKQPQTVEPAKLSITVDVAKPKPAYILEPVEASMAASDMIAVNTPLVDQAEVIKPVVESRTRINVVSKPKNAFLAGINKKLNRKDASVTNEPVVIARQEASAITSRLSRDSEPKMTSEQVQNKFLAEINKKLFRAKLDTNAVTTSELVKSKADPRVKGKQLPTVKNKELIQGADKIKAIESEISSSSNKPNKLISPSAKQVNSALMLSRLSYNSNARLPLSGAGINQLDIQGIDASSQFVNEINRNAE